MLSPAIITDKDWLMSQMMSKKFVVALFVCAVLAGCASSKKKEEELGQQQVEQLYQKGKKALDVGNYDFAIKYFHALEANYPYGKHTEQAKLDLIFAYNKAGKAAQAVEAAENFIKLYPTHKNVDYAYFMKGVATFDKKESRIDRFVKGGKLSARDPKPLRDSQKAFEELIKRYPNSVYSKDAKQRLVYIQNELASRELAIAQFYYDSKTFVAAVNRCKAIIYSYETSPVVEDALKLMEKSYVEMGLDELAKNTREVLLLNFPENSSNAPATRKRNFFSRLNPLKRKNKESN